MKKPIVVVMRGISGSGKSTLGREIERSCLGSCEVVSADEYFMLDKDGLSLSLYCKENRRDPEFSSLFKYRYEASKIGDAHLECYDHFLNALDEEVGVVVVDNTNLRLEDITPYWMSGRAYGYDVVIVNVHEFDLGVCYRRCGHGVSFDAIRRQFSIMNSVEFPDYFEFVDSCEIVSFINNQV